MARPDSPTNANDTNHDPTDGPIAVDMEHLLDRLEGRDGGLRTSKPATASDTGLTQYVWRMCRFHSGADPSMPVTAGWWLQEYVDEHTDIDASVSGIVDEQGATITDQLDAVAEVLVESFDGNPDRGAAAWSGVVN